MVLIKSKSLQWNLITPLQTTDVATRCIHNLLQVNTHPHITANITMVSTLSLKSGLARKPESLRTARKKVVKLTQCARAATSETLGQGCEGRSVCDPLHFHLQT